MEDDWPELDFEDCFVWVRNRLKRLKLSFFSFFFFLGEDPIDILISIFHSKVINILTS